MATPTWGLLGAGVKGTGSLQATPPTLAVNDLMFAVHLNNNQLVSPSTANGFVQIPLSPIGSGTAGGSPSAGLSIWAKRAATTSDPGPIFPACSGGAGLIIFTVTGVDPAAPLTHITAASVAGPSSAISIPGAETTLDECLIVGVVVDHLDSGVNRVDTATWANLDLTSITDRSFYRANAVGNGCGVAFVSGVKATKGPYSAFTATAIAGSDLKQAKMSLAIAPVAPGTQQDSDFCCSGWCAAPIGDLPTPDHRHWHVEGGTPWVASQAGAPPGGRGWRAQPSNDVSWRARTIAATGGVARFYLMINGTLPVSDMILFRFTAASGGNSPELRYRATTQDLVVGIGANLNPTPLPVIAGKRYLIDLKADVSTGTRTITLRVDGVDKGSASAALAANTLVSHVLGAGIDTPVTADLTFSVIRIGTKLSAYPFGAAHSAAMQLVADGTHSYNAAGDFTYEDGSNVPLAVTDSYTHLIGLLTDADTRISRSGAAVTEYLEWLFGGLPAFTAITSAEIVSMHRGEDTNANAQTLRLVSAASTRDLTSAYSFPGVGPYLHSAHLTLDPTGVALTTALLNAWKLRGLLTATGLGAISGVMVEVDGTLTSPPSEPGGSSELNPVHTYAGPGTYFVTRTVADNDGLTGSVTKPVVIT